MKPITAMVLAAALAAAHSAFGQPRVEAPGGPPGPRPAGAQGPWNNDVLVHRVSASGMVTSLATFERAGVPTVTRMKDGRLIAAHQHFPENDEADFDKVAVRFSSDEGRTWTAPEVMRVDGLPEGMRFPFDPTLVVLPDGRVRLYFTGMRGRMFEANQPAIYSAISTDGLCYAFEPGVRFAVEGRPVIDCAAVLHQGVFHLYSPDNGTRIGPGAAGGGGPGERPPDGAGYHAVSRDGLNFERREDVRIEGRRRWLGNAQSDGKAITFFGTGDGGGTARGGAKPSRGGVWMASSGDGREWKLMEAPEVPGADPGAVAARDGGWVVVSTGPPVPGRTGPRMMRGGQQQNPPGHQGGPFAGTMPMGDDGPPGQGPRQPGGADGGIRSHNVLSASSRDGVVWTRDAGVRIPSASVPCAINDGDKRVIVYFVQPPNQPGRPETVACAVSTDGMTFEQAPDFRIEGLSTLKAVDPSIVRDADGTFRLYYLASNHRGDPASGENPHAIHLAVSEDGIRFRETGPVFAYDDLVDPDIFQHKGRWFMYVFAKRATVIAASADGGKFTYEREMSPPGWGTVAPLALGDGRLRLYAFDQRSPSGNAVRSFLSTDGLNWTAESGDRLKAGPAEQITDPFVIPWRGGFKMYFKLSPVRTRGAIQGEGPRL